jgi:hypothetical protein
VSTVREKTALINASSQLYTQHFSLIADHFNDVGKAYSVVEQVRGRVTTDLLMAGSRTSPAARSAEQRISTLQLKLMSAQSMDRFFDCLFRTSGSVSREALAGTVCERLQREGKTIVSLLNQIQQINAGIAMNLRVAFSNGDDCGEIRFNETLASRFRLLVVG